MLCFWVQKLRHRGPEGHQAETWPCLYSCEGGEERIVASSLSSSCDPAVRYQQTCYYTHQQVPVLPLTTIAITIPPPSPDQGHILDRSIGRRTLADLLRPFLSDPSPDRHTTVHAVQCPLNASTVGCCYHRVADPGYDIATAKSEAGYIRLARPSSFDLKPLSCCKHNLGFS